MFKRLCLIPILMLFYHGFVVAQSPAVTSDEKQDDVASTQSVKRNKGYIEEVIVTVQRREQSLQDVPVTVSVFSGDDLVSANISESHGLQLKTPGMVYNSQGGYAHIYIRGIGSDGTIPTSEGSIATFLDGVYNPNANSSIQHFADVQRVEVLKGPQGTLFGRNTTGGAINITTKKPAQEFEASMALLGGSYERRGVDMYVSGPLGDALSASVSAYYDESESYYTSINPAAPPVVDNEDYGGRVKILLDISDKLSAQLTGYLTEHYGADTTVGNSFRTSLLTEAAGGRVETSNKPYKTNADRGPYFNEFRTTGVDLKLNYIADSFEFKSITAMLDTDNSGFIELDYTEADLEEVPVPKAFTYTWSQELQLSGDLWNDSLHYLVGAFYLESEGGFDPLEISLGPTAVFDATLVDLIDGTAIGELLGGIIGDGFPDAATLRTFGIIETEASAVFTNLSWQLTDTFSLSAGLRYSSETRFVTESRTEVRLLSLESVSPTLLSSPPQDKTWDAWTPMASVEWRPRDTLYYFKYSEGFKSGNYNPVLILEPVTPVEPEFIKAYEIGLKGEFFDRSLRFNFAGFFYNYDDLQVQIVSLVNSGTARLENAGNAQVYGAEAQLAFAPIEQLRFNLGASWMESEYKEYVGTGYDQTTGLAFTGDFSGNELNRAPSLTVSGDVTTHFYFGDDRLEAGVSIYHASGWYFDAQNTFEQEPFTVLGGHISYELIPSNIKLSLIGSNLTSTEYLKNALLHDFGVSGTYAPPRQIVGRIDIEF
ncbi:TonB-dependent receptor [Spongiibacter nanhainus]|uniref:TonB-dependent receptor n=1 Tax=Spongiibacter nanhainus TaxID=2794344 RepID=A0A7T4UQC3_9GAMM|nr:TonB-dependent receptor [Spongiibacter nanhainus]QQD18023.1 TonB-dependent receptor [Spongiibacter nanhainus]